MSDSAVPTLVLAAAARGEADALTRIFAAEARTVYRVAYAITLSADDAEDVVQDVFIGLPEALRQYDERGRFSSWLRMVAARTALMKRRAGSCFGSIASAGALPSADVQQAVVDRLSVEAALRALPAESRIVFVLKVVEGYTHEEIAAQLGIRRGTSEVRLFRAIRQLRGLLASTQRHL
jgi:RNA polymerase sigma-70 factor (ECF subfamily)